MELNEYQTEASKTTVADTNMFVPPEKWGLLWTGSGLAGKSGKLVELLNQHLFHKQPLNRTQVVEEVGDILWYLSALCGKLGLTLEQVAMMNLAKIEKRYPNGWDPTKSIREDTQNATAPSRPAQPPERQPQQSQAESQGQAQTAQETQTQEGQAEGQKEEVVVPPPS